MSKRTLILAEKPSVAKTVAAWLAKKDGTTARAVGRSHIAVGNYDVSWLFGHVLENVEPHEYNSRFKSWSTTDLPIIPGTWKLKPRTDKKTGAVDTGTLAQINALKTLLTDAGDVIGLGDPDQEGQLLQDEFLLWIGCTLPIKRLWLAATDDASIAKAWADMKPNAYYQGYYWSALARSHGDWLFGYNGTRACTLASRGNGGNALLSVGRVQTPTLALIVNREKEIRVFKSVNYFTPFIKLATLPEFKAGWAPDKDKDTRLDAEGRLNDKKVAASIAAACSKAATAVITDVIATKGKEHPPLLFSLSALQEHMSKKFGMGVQDVLKFAQSLYEKKIASYPRTDCDYLPDSQHSEAPTIVASLGAGIKGLGAAPKKALTSLKSRAFDDKKITAHHAIVPRPATLAQIADLNSNELLVWLEIAKRYLLQFFPIAEFLSTDIMLQCARESFRASGKVYTIRGWKDAFSSGTDKAEDEDDKASVTLPKVAKGDVLTLRDAGFDSTITKPPKRFTEGTLLAAMKSVHRYVSDPKLKAALRDNAGIGTEATRANVIGELVARKFIVLDKTYLKPEPLGEQLIDALPRQISAPDMTALWQQAMDDIKKTEEVGYRAFIASQTTWLNAMMKDVPGWFAGKSLSTAGGRPSSGPSLVVEPSAHTCLTCAGAMNRIKGKFGWFFGCANPDCKAIFKEVGGLPVAKAVAVSTAVTVSGVASGAACPKCKKGLLQARTCGAHTKTPGKTFLSCSNFFAAGKAKCDHSVWPERTSA